MSASPICGFLTNENMAMTPNSTASGYFRLFDGQTDVTSQATFGVSHSSNLVVTIDPHGGQYVVHRVAGTGGTAVFQACYQGVYIQKQLLVSLYSGSVWSFANWPNDEKLMGAMLAFVASNLLIFIAAMVLR